MKNIDNIIALAKAGFSAEQIEKIVNIKMEQTEKPKTPEPEQPKEEPKAEPAKEEPKAEEPDKINEAIANALKPFEQLCNNMAKIAGMPSIDEVKPKSLDDIIDNFFKGE